MSPLAPSETGASTVVPPVEADTAPTATVPGPTATAPETASEPSGEAVRWGPVAWARWAWRQLTSMRTALFLLFLLAVAAIPGSLFPQRGVDPARVAQYLAAHPGVAPILDRLSMFEVFSSPWFSSVYLLLMISLVGCVLPRTMRHAAALRRDPPPAPRNLSRLALHQSWISTDEPSLTLAAASRLLRRRRYHVALERDVVRAEKGHLRESGNLAFHVALLGVLAGIAVTALFGITGETLLVEGHSFVDQPGDYDALTPGRLADTAGLAPFKVRLHKFSADYQANGPQRGAPTTFQAVTQVQDRPGGPTRRQVIEVNQPLAVDGMKMFLTGHGYAPQILVRENSGRVVYDDATPFLPQDGMMTSTGVVKVTDSVPQQLGLSGFFLPTAVADPARGLVSIFPAAKNPALVLTGWAGDLGIDSGRPQSLYQLDTSAMTQMRSGTKPWSVALAPGQTAPLPGGRGSVTFTGVREFAAFKVTRDGGGPIVLGSVIIALVGIIVALSLRQRRVWVRVTASGLGSLVEVGGLARNQSAATRREFSTLTNALRTHKG